jgi:hypothetical protein
VLPKLKVLTTAGSMLVSVTLTRLFGGSDRRAGG